MRQTGRLAHLDISIARRAGTVAGLLFLWEYASKAGLVNAQILPPPSVVFVTAVQLITDWSEFARDNPGNQLVLSAYFSLTRVALGLAISVTAGLIIGYLAGWYRAVDIPVEVLIKLVRPIPPIAFIPLAIFWFGIGLAGSLFIVCLAAFFPVAVATAHGVKRLNPIYINSLRTLGATDAAIFREAILPGALPSVLTGVRIALGLGWMAVVASEMFGSTGGLGYLIAFHSESYKSAPILVGMATIGVIGYTMDRLFVRLQRYLLHWQWEG